MLDKLLADGIVYMFVSNSDNLGATLDLDLLNYFADSDKSFIMEVRPVLVPPSLPSSLPPSLRPAPPPSLAPARRP